MNNNSNELSPYELRQDIYKRIDTIMCEGKLRKVAEKYQIDFVQCFLIYRTYPDFFTSSYKNNLDLRNTIRNAKEYNLKEIISFCSCEQDLVMLLNHRYMDRILHLTQRGILGRILKFCSSMQELITLCENKNLQNIFLCVSIKKLDQALTLYKISNNQDFIDFCNQYVYLLVSDVDITDKQFHEIKALSDQIGYNNLSGEELIQQSSVVTKYKQSGSNSTYLGNAVGDDDIVGAFSMPDLITSEMISGEQKRGGKIQINNQKFYSVNDNINTERQLSVNRLFAPYLSMTRLLKIKNEKEVVVSIDVHCSEAENILKHKQNTSPHLIDFLRYIYQFVAKDNDRTSIGHNLENGIIYDFDHIMNSQNSFSRENDTSINYTELSENEKKEYAQILYFFREYIIKSCRELINSPGISGMLTYLYKGIQEQAFLLSAVNLGITTGVEEEDIEHLIEIDTYLSKMYTN